MQVLGTVCALNLGVVFLGNGSQIDGLQFGIPKEALNFFLISYTLLLLLLTITVLQLFFGTYIAWIYFLPKRRNREENFQILLP